MHNFFECPSCRYPEKISSQLCWEPETCFDEGMKKTVEWYLENQKWVDDIKNGEYAEYARRIYGDS